MGSFSFSDENGMWVRITKYAHPNPSMPSITLLPMIHIGEKAFFEEMNSEMWRHDSVFLEGAYMPARKLFHLFHRAFGAFSSLSLQSGKLPFWKRWRRETVTEGRYGLTEKIRKTGCDCGGCFYDEIRTIRADLHRWHALKAFRTIPLWAKLTYPILILAAILASPFLNFRDYSLENDDEVHKDDGDPKDYFDRLMQPFWKYAMHDRDLFLRMILAEEILRPRHKSKSLCVKYGAKHMPVLAETFLQDFGYVQTDQRDVLAVKKVKDLKISDEDAGYGFSSKKYWEEFDAKQKKAKEAVVRFAEAETKTPVPLNIGGSYEETAVSFSIQTDLSTLVDIVTPANAT